MLVVGCDIQIYLSFDISILKMCANIHTQNCHCNDSDTSQVLLTHKYSHAPEILDTGALNEEGETLDCKNG
jgi:hypothetical protein